MVRDANAHRQIEIKNPAPRIVVGNPAAECGTKDGRQQNAQAISSHGLTVFGKRLEQNGLGKRLQSAPGESLKHAKADQPGKAARQTAQQGGEGEAGDAGQQQSLATEIIGKPTGDGRDDGSRFRDPDYGGFCRALLCHLVPPSRSPAIRLVAGRSFGKRVRVGVHDGTEGPAPLACPVPSWLSPQWPDQPVSGGPTGAVPLGRSRETRLPSGPRGLYPYATLAMARASSRAGRSGPLNRFTRLPVRS